MMDTLLEKERIARTEQNYAEMEVLMQQIIDSCHGDTEIIAYLKILSKRKGQLVEPLRKTIQSCFASKYSQIQHLLPPCEYKFVHKDSALSTKANKTPDYIFTDFETSNTLHIKSDDETNIQAFINFSLNLLKEIVEGQFTMEKERVFITRTLKHVFESLHRYKEAMDIIYDVPIESFSSIEDKKKIQYQLEILRLCFLNKEWHRCEITKKRMKKGYFEKNESKKEEINLNILQIGIALGQKKFLEVAYRLKKLLEIDNKDGQHRIILCSFFSIISEPSKYRNELLNFCHDSPLNNHKTRARVKDFLGIEILNRQLSFDFGSDICVKKCETEYLKAIDFHNLDIISNFFESIQLEDLVEIIQVSPQECIDLVSHAVNIQFINCKISQMDGIVEFEQIIKSDEADDIENVLNQITKIGYMIDDEYIKA